MVSGFSYLYATNLLARQSGDVFSTIPADALAGGASPKGMHSCAKACRKEGPGVCASWTFCWGDGDGAKCSLLSRLPASTSPAKPPTTLLERAAAGVLAVPAAYNPKCASGFSVAARTMSELQSSCKATVHASTTLGDTNTWFSSARNPSHPLNIDYDAAQPSASACCALCESMRYKGCTAWTYNPRGWLTDASKKCQLKAGAGPVMTHLAGVTSGVMQ